MPMLSVECTAFRLTEIMSKRTVESAENKFVLSTSVSDWLHGELMDNLIFYDTKHKTPYPNRL